MSEIIQIKNLTKKYGDVIGIKNLDLSINKGEIFGFLGQNGSGKTTTIRCLLSILLPSEGEMYVNGQLVSRDSPEIRDEIGYLPGELNIPGKYTVKGYLAYINALRGKDPVLLDDIVERFDIPMDKKVGQLSKGNKQKLGIAIAFMNDPDIYILDEPSSGLDPIFQQKLYDLILEEKAKGKTVFFSSHNLDEVQKICDRVAIIREGELVTIEDVHKLTGKVRRVMRVMVNNFDKTAFSFLGEKLISSNEETKEIEIVIADVNEIADILIQLSALGVVDVSYPPASLEEYFLSKYK